MFTLLSFGATVLAVLAIRGPIDSALSRWTLDFSITTQLMVLGRGIEPLLPA
jgi:hypothetical protein